MQPARSTTPVESLVRERPAMRPAAPSTISCCCGHEKQAHMHTAAGPTVRSATARTTTGRCCAACPPAEPCGHLSATLPSVTDFRHDRRGVPAGPAARAGVVRGSCRPGEAAVTNGATVTNEAPVGRGVLLRPPGGSRHPTVEPPGWRAERPGDGPRSRSAGSRGCRSSTFSLCAPPLTESYCRCHAAQSAASSPRLRRHLDPRPTGGHRGVVGGLSSGSESTPEAVTV
jgi:hypothetical protein